MSKKIMFLLTTSILSLGIITGCSGNTGNAQSDNGSNAAAQSDTQNVTADNSNNASENSVNTVIGSGITANSGGNTSQTTGSNGNYISEEEASAIALAEVNGATEDELRIHRDYDDGREIYEGSIIYNEMEYEFEIDAQTGDIIEWCSESVYDD